MSSAYERERLAKIERNKSRLAALGLHNVKIGENDSQQTPTTSSAKKEKKQQQTPSSTERRVSSRLKLKQPATYNYNELVKKQTKMEEEFGGGNSTSAQKKRKKKVKESPRPVMLRRRGYSERLANSPSVLTIDDDEEDDEERTSTPGRRTSERLKKKRRTFAQFDLSVDERLLDRLTKSDNQSPVIMFTQEVLTSEKCDLYVNVIEALGGTVEYEDITKCTHLISTQFRRSIRHLCAIGLALRVMNVKWFSASNSFGAWVEESQFLLKAPTAVEIALANAQSKKIFEGHSFYVTPSVVPPKQYMEQVIGCSGGVILTDITHILNVEASDVDSLSSIKHIHIISCAQDLPNLDITDQIMLRISGVHEAEFVLSSVYTQTIDPDNLSLMDLSSAGTGQASESENNTNVDDDTSQVLIIDGEQDGEVAMHDEHEQSSAEIA